MANKRTLTGSMSLILTFAVCVATHGQPPQPESALAESQFATLRNQVTASSLTDEEKKPLLEALAKADAEMIETKQALEVTSKNTAAAASTATRSEKLNADLNSLSDFQPEHVAQNSLPELESALLAIESDLTKARTAVTDAEAATAQSVQRRRQIETDATALEKQLAERRAQLESSRANPADNLSAAIQQAALQSSVTLLEASIESMKSELALIEARTNAGIYQLQRDVNARRVETIQQQQQLTAAAVEKTRAVDASRRVAAAAELLTHLHPALVPIGEQNAKLAEQNKVLAQKVDESRQLLARRSLRLEEIQTLYNQAKVRVETVGLTDAVGALLRNLKQALPSASAYRLRGRERQPEINDAQYALIELTDQRNVKLDIAVATLLRSTKSPIPFSERSDLETEARDLLEQQRSEYLDPAIRSQTTYFNTLVSLSTTEQQIVELVDTAVLYANERILWIRSSHPLHHRLIPAEEELWFRFGAVWERVPEKFYQQMTANPLVWTSAFLVLVLLLRIKARLRHGIATIGEKVKQSTFTQFTPTIESLGLTILAASPITLVFGFVAWQISPIAGNDPALLAIMQASIVISAGFFPLEFLRQSCRPGGLGVSHFEWSPNSADRLKRALWWVIATALPLIAITSFLNAGTLTFGNDTLERYFYLAAIVIVTLFVARMMNPRTGLPAAALRKRPTGWFSRTAFIWYPLSVSIPLTLGLLAIVGYYFTSQQLARKLFDTLCLTMAIVMAISLGLRWVVVNQRRVRIEEARKRREAAAKQTTGETSVSAPLDAAHALQTQMQQTRRVLNTVVLTTSVIGAWIVWNDVFPALGFLENWPLWTSTTSVTESLPGISGNITTTTREIPDPVTITDLMFAGFILGVTFIATGNLPGLLEFSLLRRLPLDSSVRYAITTLASYGIVLVGLICAGQSVGLHWNQIQWMATALTFGLAFGLQEMFANFIAGIIILFEQPVRVGDVVEIDGVTGVVSQIRIRATTITNWDRMDYIVPNKEFITGKLLNWTRSDNITRVTVDIGVAYGSDTENVRELLLQVANEHPEVMDDPAAMAVFHGFGDNCLNFSLRLYVSNPDRRLSVTHDIHTQIDKVFRAESIEISFPQRDLHLRSVPEDFERIFRSPQTPDNIENDGRSGGTSTTKAN